MRSFLTSIQLLPEFMHTTMPPADQHEEQKVQQALELIRQNPGIKLAEAARQTRASYPRLLRRNNGIPRSLSRGGHNKKLNKLKSGALKEYLLMCHGMGRGAGLEHVVAAANSILRHQRGEVGGASRR